MNNYIFEKIDYKNDPYWVVKDFYNSINLADKFIWALPFIVEKVGCGVEESFCDFPDYSSNDTETFFEGINFGIYGAQIIVSEKIGFQITKKACDNFIHLHPEKKKIVINFIKSIEEMGY